MNPLPYSAREELKGCAFEAHQEGLITKEQAHFLADFANFQRDLPEYKHSFSLWRAEHEAAEFNHGKQIDEYS